MCDEDQSYGARVSEKQAAEALGADNVRYILSAVWWNAQLGTQGITKKFVDAFKAKHKRDPEWYQAMGYESARALFLGIEKAGTLDLDKVRDALAARDVESIVPGGEVQFQHENGEQALFPVVVPQNQPEGTGR